MLFVNISKLNCLPELPVTSRNFKYVDESHSKTTIQNIDWEQVNCIDDMDKDAYVFCLKKRYFERSLWKTGMTVKNYGGLPSTKTSCVANIVNPGC